MDDEIKKLDLEIDRLKHEYDEIGSRMDDLKNKRAEMIGYLRYTYKPPGSDSDSPKQRIENIGLFLKNKVPDYDILREWAAFNESLRYIHSADIYTVDIPENFWNEIPDIIIHEDSASELNKWIETCRYEGSCLNPKEASRIGSTKLYSIKFPMRFFFRVPQNTTIVHPWATKGLPYKHIIYNLVDDEFRSIKDLVYKTLRC